MGKRPDFVAQTRQESPKSLIDFATSLEEAAKTLRAVAAGMLAKPIMFIKVRYSPGANAALSNSIEPFVADAKKKAKAKGVDLVYNPPRAIPAELPIQIPPQ